MSSDLLLEKTTMSKKFGVDFWRFHIGFWSVAALVLFLSGLSQMYPVDVALLRNILYGILGTVASLLFIPLFDKYPQSTLKYTLFVSLFGSYLIGTFITLLVNPITAIQAQWQTVDGHWTIWFGGSLNFSLVLLVWCGFYLAFKHGLQFLSGQEEKKAAQAISSLSAIASFPEFLALERNKNVVLLPIENVLYIQAAGDYVEIISEEGTFLKRESLSNMQSLLNPKLFQRVHRSAIVNVQAIKEMEPKGKGDYTLILHAGSRVSASRSYMKRFKTRFYGVS